MAVGGSSSRQQWRKPVQASGPSGEISTGQFIWIVLALAFLGGGIAGYAANTSHGTSNPFTAAWHSASAIYVAADRVSAAAEESFQPGFFSWIVKIIAFGIALPVEIFVGIGAFLGNLAASLLHMF